MKENTRDENIDELLKELEAIKDLSEVEKGELFFLKALYKIH